MYMGFIWPFCRRSTGLHRAHITEFGDLHISQHVFLRGKRKLPTSFFWKWKTILFHIYKNTRLCKIADMYAHNRYWSGGIHFGYYLLARANRSLLEASECQWNQNTKRNGHECFLWWICCCIEHVTSLGYEYGSCEHEEYLVGHLRPWSGWCFSWLVCYHQAPKFCFVVKKCTGRMRCSFYGKTTQVIVFNRLYDITR